MVIAYYRRLVKKPTRFLKLLVLGLPYPLGGGVGRRIILRVFLGDPLTGTTYKSGGLTT